MENSFKTADTIYLDINININIIRMVKTKCIYTIKSIKNEIVQFFSYYS
jgi:hypothetical protein